MVSVWMIPRNILHGTARGLAPAPAGGNRSCKFGRIMWDVIVVGAGAAGLMAAIHAAERGKRTLLLEKNHKPGVKILMSGGTRCNITHATDNRGIVAAYGPPGKFLHSALAAFSVADTIAFFEAEGVATKIEETGKIFPVSNKALDVLNALLHRLERPFLPAGRDEPDRGRDAPGRRVEPGAQLGFLRSDAVRAVTLMAGVAYPAAQRNLSR